MMNRYSWEPKDEKVRANLSEKVKKEFEANAEALNLSVAGYIRFLHNEFGDKVVDAGAKIETDNDKGFIFDPEALEEWKHKLFDEKILEQ